VAAGVVTAPSSATFAVAPAFAFVDINAPFMRRRPHGTPVGTLRAARRDCAPALTRAMYVPVAEQWFLKIDGIEGESTNDAHKAEIDVESWSWGVTQTGASPLGAGGGSPKSVFQDMHFVARISKASPQLFLACATNSHLKLATLSGARTAGKTVDFLKYKLSDVQVTGVQHSASEVGAPIEQFSLQYHKFEISYSEQTASGKLGPATTVGFDVQQNKKL